jgi:hypothetical protein
MNLNVHSIRRAYQRLPLSEKPWKFSRKHFRIELLNGVFVKLNRFENRIHAGELQRYLFKYAPRHAFMSVTDYLFPERVGRKCKAKYAVPIGGEFVVDVDSFMRKRMHDHSWHPQYEVCEGCLDISKHLTLELCDRIQATHQNIQTVFSGRRGFHIHILDFNYRDWSRPNPRNPMKAMAAARYRYASKVLPGTVWDKNHFIVSVDPMRVITVPNTLNLDTGLICLHIGYPKNLESTSIPSMLEQAAPTRYIWDTGFQLVMVTLSPRRAMKSAARKNRWTGPMPG